MNSCPTNTCPYHLVVNIHFSTHLEIRNSELLGGWTYPNWIYVVGGKKRSIPLTLNYDSLGNRTLDFIPSSSSTSYCESLGHPPTHSMSFSERLSLVGRLSQMMMSIHISSMNVDIYHSGLLVRLCFIALPRKPSDRHPNAIDRKKDGSRCSGPGPRRRSTSPMSLSSSPSEDVNRRCCGPRQHHRVVIIAHHTNTIMHIDSSGGTHDERGSPKKDSDYYE